MVAAGLKFINAQRTHNSLTVKNAIDLT